MVWYGTEWDGMRLRRYAVCRHRIWRGVNYDYGEAGSGVRGVVVTVPHSVRAGLAASACSLPAEYLKDCIHEYLQRPKGLSGEGCQQHVNIDKLPVFNNQASFKTCTATSLSMLIQCVLGSRCRVAIPFIILRYYTGESGEEKRYRSKTSQENNGVKKKGDPKRYQVSFLLYSWHGAYEVM